MECQKTTKQIAYPVFYDVDPSEVRKQLGPVGEAFSRHSNKEEVAKWREALEEATNLAGWDLRNTADGHEAKVINKIVEKISLELRCINLRVDEKLIGMESRVNDIILSLENGVDDVRMIGIKGIGGGGKTTLARAVFDKIWFLFEGKSFVENVREVSKASGLGSLQEHVLCNVLNDRSLMVGSVHDGKNMIRDMLCRKKVLLVLDDVDHLDQLDALASGLNWFKSGSRIIITTRDEQLLIAHRVKSIHDVNLFSQEEAMCLFSRYAFGRDVPIQMYKELSLEVVHYAAGLPLTVRVLGSFLCGKDELEWKDALQRLKRIPLKETSEKLELSYTGLEDDYKEIFLDVVCLLKGWNKEKAIRALECCGFHARNGLRVLEQRSLVTVSRYQELSMHDHIEEMGRNIVRRLHPDEPMRHSRLWIQGEIEDVLAKDLVTEATRAVASSNYSRRYNKILLSNTKGFGNMKKLRFLHVFSGSAFCFEVGQNFPSALRFLSWQGYPHRCLPKTFQPNNLVGLEMVYSKIEELWKEGGRKVLYNLRFLDLSYSNLITLDCGLLPNLEKLNLQKCFDLVEIRAPSGCLTRLVHLDLNSCRGFKSLSFIKQPKQLQVLNLSYLYLTEFPDILPGHSNNSLLKLSLSNNNIGELPSSIGNLQKLVSLYLSQCTNLKSLPQSICSLPCLKVLDLESCAIDELPEDIGHLECLETLNLRRTHIKHLSKGICKLKHLKTLIVECCKALKELPEDIGRLEYLEKLSLAFCKIRDIPSSICKLKHLREFDLAYCHQIQKLPEELGDLKCLQELNVKGTSISHLPQSISLLKGLKITGFTPSSRVLSRKRKEGER